MNLLIQYAMSFIGTPYVFGSDNPLNGIDCSGFVQLVLRSAGMDPKGDQSAQTLYDYFAQHSTMGAIGPGTLAFYGLSVKAIGHVAFMVDNYRIIEAGGGGRDTLSIDLAKTKPEAMVRMRLLKYRPDLVATLKPNYNTIGLI